MFKMNQLVVGLFLFLSSLFSCQQKGDFKTVNVEDFDSIIQFIVAKEQTGCVVLP